MHRSLIILSIYECAGVTFGSSLFRWRSWSEQGPHSIPQPSPSNPMHTVVVVGLRRLWGPVIEISTWASTLGSTHFVRTFLSFPFPSILQPPPQSLYFDNTLLSLTPYHLHPSPKLVHYLSSLVNLFLPKLTPLMLVLSTRIGQWKRSTCLPRWL